MPGTPFRDQRYDAVVVGARCAGAATARLLASGGLKVLALERTRHGSDTLSTHALMRAGVLQLHRWGVLPAVTAAGTPPVHTTTFSYADETIEVAIKARDGVPALFAPRRTVLDALLQDAAAAAGAEIVYGVRVVGLTRDDDGRVRGVVVEGGDGSTTAVATDIVIGADGLNSAVARAVGAEVEHLARDASGVVYGYVSGLGLEGYHWYWQPGVGVGVIPTNDGDACIFAATSSARFRAEIRSDIVAGYHRLLAEAAPGLASSVAAMPHPSKLKAFAGAAGFLRRSWGPGWALVGDAGYFKDPITAHGISDALRDAELLARAVIDGTPAALAAYQVLRDDLSRGLLELTGRIASYSWTLEELKQMHLRLSTEMNREVALLLRLDEAQEAGGGSRLALSA